MKNVTSKLVSWASGLLLGVACLPLGIGCDSGPGSHAEAEYAAETPMPVQTQRLVASDGYEVRERFAGRVVAGRRSELGFERGGRVVAVAVDEGAVVTEGQELARLENRQLLASRAELEARVAETLSRLELAKRTTQRRKRLFDQASLSEQAYDEARFEQAALTSSLEAARASLQRVRVELALSVLVAPYSGVVLERKVDEGTVVQPGQTLLRVIESGATEFRVGLPLATLRGLSPGTAYEIQLDGGPRRAVLRTVLPTVEPETRTSTAIFSMEAPDPAERADSSSMLAADGEIGHVAITGERSEPGFWVPLGSLTESRRGLWSVFVVEDLVPEGTGHVERREVQVIHAEADRAFVRGTIRDGELLVGTGLHRIVQGQTVRPIFDLASTPLGG